MKIEAAQRAASISINNIDGNLHAGTLGIGADDSPDLLCDATLTADDLAHVVGGDTQLQRQLLIAMLRPPDQRTSTFFSRALTVSVG